MHPAVSGLVHELRRGIKCCLCSEERPPFKTERALTSPEKEDLRVGTSQGRSYHSTTNAFQQCLKSETSRIPKTLGNKRAELG